MSAQGPYRFYSSMGNPLDGKELKTCIDFSTFCLRLNKQLQSRLLKGFERRTNTHSMSKYNCNDRSELQKLIGQNYQQLYQLFAFLTLHLQERCMHELQEFE